MFWSLPLIPKSALLIFSAPFEAVLTKQTDFVYTARVPKLKEKVFYHNIGLVIKLHLCHRVTRMLIANWSLKIIVWKWPDLIFLWFLLFLLNLVYFYWFLIWLFVVITGTFFFLMLWSLRLLYRIWFSYRLNQDLMLLLFFLLILYDHMWTL